MCHAGLGGIDFDLSGFAFGVVVEGYFAEIVWDLHGFYSGSKNAPSRSQRANDEATRNKAESKVSLHDEGQLSK